MRYWFKIFIHFFVVLSVFFTACQISRPVSVETSILSLYDPMISSPLYLQNSSAGVLEVKVDSPEGLEYVQSIFVNVYNDHSGELVWADTLADDGMEGDIIPHDGRYFTLIPGDFSQNQTGIFKFVLKAVDIHGIESDTLSVKSEAVNAFRKPAPVITNASVPDTLDLSSSNEAVFSCVVSAAHEQGEIDSVKYSIYYSQRPESIYSAHLQQDTAGGNTVESGIVFRDSINISDKIRTSGLYWVRFQCWDNAQQSSLPVLRSFYLKSDNDPPVILQVTAPDTLSRTTSEAVILAVQVDDPQGLADIKSVTFNTHRPDGTPAGGNPFAMFDDGTNGDAVAGDGIYSLQIYISSQNALGNYRFDFYAEDFGGLKVGPESHIMTVVE